MQAILTKYFGPTNTRGSRIVASNEARRITVPYDHALNGERNHEAAAEALRKKMGWDGVLEAGALPGDKGYAHVFVSAEACKRVKKSRK